MRNVNSPNRSFPWKWESYPYLIGEHPYTLLEVLNTDELLEDLIAKGPDDPDYQDEKIPYWADIWPSSLGLAEYLLLEKETLTRQSVLEIGCGMGLPGLVASQLGAQVCLTDYLAEAFDAADLLWDLNDQPAPTCNVLDWRKPDDSWASDIVLASDVIYEERNYLPLMKALPCLLKPGGYALLSEPRRMYSKNFFSLLSQSFRSERVFTSSVDWKGSQQQVDVYKIERKDT